MGEHITEFQFRYEYMTYNVGKICRKSYWKSLRMKNSREICMWNIVQSSCHTHSNPGSSRNSLDTETVSLYLPRTFTPLDLAPLSVRSTQLQTTSSPFRCLFLCATIDVTSRHVLSKRCSKPLPPSHHYRLVLASAIRCTVTWSFHLNWLFKVVYLQSYWHPF